MPVYMVSYDILNEGGTHDYEPLWKDLKSVGAQSVQDGLWVVELDSDLPCVESRFAGFLDRGDRLLVSCLKNGQFLQSQSRSGTDAWLAAHPPGE